MIDLIPDATEFYQMRAICYDHDGAKVVAPFSYRKVKDDAKVVIGGADKYIAVCADCYDKLNR
jgi:thymidine kinase